MKKLSWKAVLKMFATIYFVLFLVAWGLSYLVPVMACLFSIVVAACASGNTAALFVSMWIFPALIAAVTSPFMVDYVRLRNERKAMAEK